MHKRVPRVVAAEGMLKEAVRMLFNQRDLVSVFALAESALQLLQVISTRDKVSSELSSSQLGEVCKEQDWDSVWGGVNTTTLSAISDCGDDVEVDVVKVHTLLLDALLQFARVSEGVMREGQVFIVWFALKYPELIRHRCHGSMIDPNIAQGLSPEDLASFNQLLDHPDLFPLLMKKGFWKERSRAAKLQQAKSHKRYLGK